MPAQRKPAPADASPPEPPVATIVKNAGEDVRVSLSAFAGCNLIDVRTHMDLSDGVRRPTKKGVNLRVEKLPELIEGLQVAAQEALRRGLLVVPAAGQDRVTALIAEKLLKRVAVDEVSYAADDVVVASTA